MDAIRRGLTHAARRLLRSPTFTAATLTTLALAIGANVAIFTLVNRVVLNPLPYPDSDRLIDLDHAAPGMNANSVRQGGVVALAGSAVGLGAALAGSRVIESLLYEVSPRDPVVLATTMVALVAIALTACWLPARRASRVSPLQAMRAE
jgi:hypothetical protein